MKKLMILAFLSFVLVKSHMAEASSLLKIAGVEVYAWDSEKKLKIEQMDVTVLDKLQQDFGKNLKDLETVFVRDQKLFVKRGKDFLVAFNERGEVLQYSGPLNIKLEGKTESRVELVDVVKI